MVSVTRTPMHPAGFVALHRDITEDIGRLETAQRNEAEMALQNMRFTAAVNNMSQGLCMYDGDERLIICNAVYVSLYRLPPELTRPGTPQHEIAAYRRKNGMGPASGIDRFARTDWAPRDGETARTQVLPLEDGRLISIQYQPTPDGGWVATHEESPRSRGASPRSKRASARRHSRTCASRRRSTTSSRASACSTARSGW
jgi:PAS domain-containing protein